MCRTNLIFLIFFFNRELSAMEKTHFELNPIIWWILDDPTILKLYLLPWVSPPHFLYVFLYQLKSHLLVWLLNYFLYDFISVKITPSCLTIELNIHRYWTSLLTISKYCINPCDRMQVWIYTDPSRIVLCTWSERLRTHMCLVMCLKSIFY